MKKIFWLVLGVFLLLLSNTCLAEQARVVLDGSGKVLSFSKEINVRPSREVILNYELPKNLSVVPDMLVLVEKLQAGIPVIVQAEKVMIKSIFPKIITDIQLGYEAVIKVTDTNEEWIYFVKKSAELNEEEVKNTFKMMAMIMMFVIVFAFVGGVMAKKNQKRQAIFFLCLALVSVVEISVIRSDVFAHSDASIAIIVFAIATIIATAYVSATVITVAKVTTVFTAALTTVFATAVVVADIGSELVSFQLWLAYFLPQLVGCMIIWRQKERK